MYELWFWISAALGLELDNKHLSVWQMSLRALIVFVASIVMLRIGDKRFMGKNTAFDVMLGIVFGSVVSRAITGNSPFFPTLAAGLVLVLLHWVLGAIAYRSHGFGRLVKGHKRQLVRGGEPLRDEMRKAHVTEHDLAEALRLAGREPDLGRIEEAYLERNGDISFKMKKGAEGGA